MTRKKICSFVTNKIELETIKHEVKVIILYVEHSWNYFEFEYKYL